MKIYSYEEALKSSLEYFKGDEIAARNFIKKYCLKDNEGNLLELNPDDMHWRIAREFARVENNYPFPISEEEIYDLLKDFKYIIPQGSPMEGIGNSFKITSLSNCFVIDSSEDSYASVMKVDEEQVHLMRRRGGVGHDLSSFRPAGMGTSGSSSATGIIPFAERFSNTTREVGQDGRRGALMLSCDIRHPEVENFIDSKIDLKKITGANISIKISDEFMESVLEGKNFIQQFPINSDNPKFKKEINPKKIWNKIIHNAHKSAEPGILFWDQIIRESPANKYGDEWLETSTNPCAELPLCPYDSCRLLVLNLYSYVNNPFTTSASFDYELFKHHSFIAQRLMDDLIDLELEKVDRIIVKIKSDPEEYDTKYRELKLWLKIRNKCELGRRTGLGVTAEGDMLAALGIKYGTIQATEFSENIHRLLATYSYCSSIVLANQRGAFPIWDKNKDDLSPFVQRVLKSISTLEDREIYLKMYEETGRRNIANLTIAPTGTTSLMAQTTSGIEPAFTINYKRRVKINPTDQDTRVDFVDEVGDRWQVFNVFHEKFKEWYNVIGYKYLDEKKSVLELSDSDIDFLFTKSPYFGATSNDVDWLEKVRMQGMIQRWVDHSISVTVNVPENTTKEMVASIYEEAWRSGCKGCTVYRDGSRSGVLINNEEQRQKFQYRDVIKRPKSLQCDIHHPSIKGEKWIVLVGLMDGLPYEVFGVKNSTGLLSSYTKGELIKVSSGVYNLKIDGDGIIEDISSLFERPIQEYATRLMSWGLRSGGDIKFLIEQLDKAPADSLVSFNKVMARVLKKYIPNKQSKEDCELCGTKLMFKEGCQTCPSCGWSKCG